MIVCIILRLYAEDSGFRLSVGNNGYCMNYNDHSTLNVGTSANVRGPHVTDHEMDAGSE